MSVGGLKASQIVGMGEYMKWLEARELVNRAQGLGRATPVVAHAWRYLIGCWSVGKKAERLQPPRLSGWAVTVGASAFAKVR